MIFHEIGNVFSNKINSFNMSAALIDNADVVDSVANLQLTVATLQSDRFDLLQRIEELQDRLSAVLVSQSQVVEPIAEFENRVFSSSPTAAESGDKSELVTMRSKLRAALTKSQLEIENVKQSERAIGAECVLLRKKLQQAERERDVAQHQLNMSKTSLAEARQHTEWLMRCALGVNPSLQVPHVRVTPDDSQTSPSGSSSTLPSPVKSRSPSAEPYARIGGSARTSASSGSLVQSEHQIRRASMILPASLSTDEPSAVSALLGACLGSQSQLTAPGKPLTPSARRLKETSGAEASGRPDEPSAAARALEFGSAEGPLARMLKQSK